MTEKLRSGNARSALGRLTHDSAISRVEQTIERLESMDAVRSHGQDVAVLRDQLSALTERAYDNLTGWETVQLARHPRRPRFADYRRLIVSEYAELHGDRCFGDDRSLLTGFGRIGEHRVLLVGHAKGLANNPPSSSHDKPGTPLGYAHPEGYRKAMQKMKLAEKYGLPIVTWIDTPGAYPGIGAEERGIAYAIARNLMEMSRLRVPILCIILGEGGSGGAIGIGVGDRVAMLRHAYYSVISPEGCASILFRSSDRAQHAADALQLRSSDLLRAGLIDDVIDEPLGGAHKDPEQAGALLASYIDRTLRSLRGVSTDALLEARQDRLRKIGCAFEQA